MKWNNEVKWNVIAWLVDCAEIQIYVMFLTMFRRCWENFQYKIFVSYLEAFFEWNRRYSYTHKHTHTLHGESIFSWFWLFLSFEKRKQTFSSRSDWCEWTMVLTHLYTIFPIRFNSFSDDSNLIICSFLFYSRKHMASSPCTYRSISIIM